MEEMSRLEYIELKTEDNKSVDCLYNSQINSLMSV